MPFRVMMHTMPTLVHGQDTFGLLPIGTEFIARPWPLGGFVKLTVVSDRREEQADYTVSDRTLLDHFGCVDDEEAGEAA